REMQRVAARRSVAVEEHRAEQAPVFVLDEDAVAHDRAEAGQLVAIQPGAGDDLDGEADQDRGDQDRSGRSGPDTPRIHRRSSSVEARRMKRCASWGHASLKRMYIAASSGRMRRYRPSCAAAQIARATRSGGMPGISREAPGIFRRSAVSKNPVSVVP